MLKTATMPSLLVVVVPVMAPGRIGRHVTQIFIHIHDISLHRQARSDGVGRTAAIGLIGGGIGRTEFLLATFRAALEAFGVGIGEANSHRVRPCS